MRRGDDVFYAVVFARAIKCVRGTREGARRAARAARQAGCRVAVRRIQGAKR